jgi:pSer/pThr/pTyr-binding forkhead associated (FHA) protein
MVSTLESTPTPRDTPATGVTRETPAVSPLSERDRTRAAARLPQPAPGRYLAVPDGDEVALVPLREPTTRLGRSHTADVVLEDASVSRRHALIVRRDGRSVLLDDRSLNGIQVNGARVSEAPLNHGDEILLGRIAVRYVEVGGSEA